jgi:hypothetical protein
MKLIFQLWKKAVDKLQSDVEKLKDKQREFGNGGNH